MDKLYYNEMVDKLNELEKSHLLQEKEIYLFGHCNATEELADLLIKRKYVISAILDNNVAKQGMSYKGIGIVSPVIILQTNMQNVIVCIAARAYAAMYAQLRKLGFCGKIIKLVDYNSFAEYDLSENIIAQMNGRVSRGMYKKVSLEQQYPDYFKILCPFSALGDVFLTMSYLPYYLKKRGIANCVICVIGDGSRQVVELFGTYHVVVYVQKDMDELIQACLYSQDKSFFIAHQDRPYVINLHRALYMKCIPLEQIYCCGVFGMSWDIEPVKPGNWEDFPELNKIPRGKAVIFSPYAKSVTMLPSAFWKETVQDFYRRGYECFTNIVGDEKPLEGTTAICPSIAQLQSVVEQAGIFIGIRSGLCDVIRYADCRKIAVYPNYNYCDTQWKAINMYAIDGWENIEVKDGFQWKGN